MESIAQPTALCVGRDASVLYSDFTWRAAGSLIPGDRVVAFDADPEGRGRHRKLRIAVITRTSGLTSPCVRLRTDDGRDLLAASDLVWLSARAGRGPRPTLCDQCDSPPFKNWQGLSSHRRWVHQSPGTWAAQGHGTWIRTEQLRAETQVKDLGQPWPLDASYEAGYLGGVFDGEASFQSRAAQGTFCISFAQKGGEVLDRTRQLLKQKGFREYQGTYSADSSVWHVPVRGIYDCFRFLGQCQPVRLLAKSAAWLDGASPFNRHGAGSVAIESAENVGACDLVALETSTATMFVEGMFSGRPAA